MGVGPDAQVEPPCLWTAVGGGGGLGSLLMWLPPEETHSAGFLICSLGSSE